MLILTGKLENVEYFDTSRNGNSRYSASIGGVRFFTGVDSCLGSAITNYRDKYVSVPVSIIRGKLTIDGRIEAMPWRADAAYYRNEFAVIYSDMSYKPTLQIRGNAGHTRCMNLTIAQLRAIEQIMLDPVLAADDGVTK